MAKKPTSDKEYLEYQKEVCQGCKNQFDLERGIFTKGCKPVDLYGMSTPDKMIREDGTCIFFEGGDNKNPALYYLKDKEKKS
jgi:hypothetical protein